jgi:hypothetical protein
MRTSGTRAVLLLTIVFALAGSYQPAAAQSTVYKNDFSLGTATGFAPGISGSWSTASTSFTPSGRYGQFLGEFGSETVRLTLTNLPPHREVTLSCLLLILKSWDGNQLIDPVSGLPVGPDVWGCTVTDGPALLTTTFSNINHFTGNGYPGITYPQAFPGTYPGASFPPGTGSAETNTLGYRFAGVPMDAVYPLSFTFSHTGSTLTLNFVGPSNSQGIADESWGLDNVEVRLDAAAAAPSPSDLEFQAFLVRIAGDLYVVGTATNRSSSEAKMTLRSATLALFDPLEFHEATEDLPLALGVLAPGEARSFGARFPDAIGPPGRGAAVTVTGLLQWRGGGQSPQLFSRDFNNMQVP